MGGVRKSHTDNRRYHRPLRTSIVRQSFCLESMCINQGKSESRARVFDLLSGAVAISGTRHWKVTKVAMTLCKCTVYQEIPKSAERVGWDARVGWWRDWLYTVTKLPQLYCAHRMSQVTSMSPEFVCIVYSPQTSAAAATGPYHPPISMVVWLVHGVRGITLGYEGFLRQ